MKLRAKAFLFFGGAVVLFFGLVAGLTQWVLLPNAERVEIETMGRNLRRVEARIGQRLQQLAARADDQARSAGARDKVDGIEGLSGEDLTRDHLSVVARSDASGGLARGVQLGEGKTGLEPLGAARWAELQGIAARGSGAQSGLMRFDGGIVLAAAAPLAEGGAIVLGERLDDRLIDQFQINEDFLFTVHPDGRGLTALADAERLEHGAEAGVLGPNELIGHLPLRAVDGRLVGMIEAHTGRPLHDLLFGSLVLVLGGLGALMLVLCGLGWWVLDRFFISPVELLTRQVAMLDKVGPIEGLEATPGTDEVAQLARATGKMARNLSEARETAESADRAKSEFLAMMSHEIRTPLNGMLGYTSLLKGMPLAPEQAELVQTIDQSGETLLMVINEILDYSKIEAGRLELESRPVRLRELVAEVGRVFLPRLAEKGVTYREVVGADVPEAIETDPFRLRQILLNLLGNAVKFTPSGEIAVMVEVTAAVEGGPMGLRFDVSDTGIGMSDTEKARLFRPFSQADTSTTRKYGGTGLGLAICQRLVRAMGGDIGVESEFGTGSTFGFVLPVKVAVAPVKAAVMAANGTEVIDASFAGRHPLRILVAEDNVVNRKMIGAMLKKFGYEPDFVEDGRQAFNAIEKRSYDLIFMDMQMPVMDGPATSRAIRNWERATRSPRVHITALTANAMAGDREKCLEAGMDDYLTKPLRLDELRAAFERVHG